MEIYSSSLSLYFFLLSPPSLHTFNHLPKLCSFIYSQRTIKKQRKMKKMQSLLVRMFQKSFSTLSARKEKKRKKKFNKNGLFVLPIIFMKNFSCFQLKPAATTLLINSCRKLFSKLVHLSIYLYSWKLFKPWLTVSQTFFLYSCCRRPYRDEDIFWLWLVEPPCFPALVT